MHIELVIDKKYKHLIIALETIHDTVIDYEWKEIISNELLSDMLDMSCLKSYDELLQVYEGLTLREFCVELNTPN